MLASAARSTAWRSMELCLGRPWGSFAPPDQLPTLDGTQPAPAAPSQPARAKSALFGRRPWRPVHVPLGILALCTASGSQLQAGRRQRRSSPSGGERRGSVAAW